MERKKEEEKRRQEEERKAKDQAETNEAIKDAVRCILRDKLIYLMQRAERDGYAPVYVVENVATMFESYQGLHGNGLVAQLFDQFQKLPHVAPGKDEKEEVGG